MTPQLALRIAIRRAGGMSALCRKLKLKNYQTVQGWVDRGLPDEWLVAVEKVTKVPREQLRPDLFRGRTLVPSEELEPA